MATVKKSLFERILDGAIEAVRKPFVVKRVNRAFESAADSLEEQLMSVEASLNSARESFVNAAKNEGSLQTYLQKLIELQTQKSDVEKAQAALTTEKKVFLEEKTEVEA